MKKYLLFLTFFALNVLSSGAQSSSGDKASVDTAVVKHFRQIIKLIESDNATELSKLISYPLKRENPLPDIENPTDFISHYKLLFDSSFKNLLKQYNDSDIFNHEDSYGLVGGNFSGEIWINEDGKISAINYSSKEEKTAKQILIDKIKNEMYPAVSSWNENVLVARSEKLLIRVDRTDKGLRYACWSNKRTIKDSPDIVLYEGVEDAHGTMGGWTLTFKNGDWTYLVDDVELCEEEKNCGLFLELSFKDKLKSRTKLAETK
jgi:hypothetical protein